MRVQLAGAVHRTARRLVESAGYYQAVTLIGIDVGWSEKRPTCGIAVSGDALNFPPARTGTRKLDEGPIRARRYRKSEMLSVLRSWADQQPHLLEGAVVVVDGPLSPAGYPKADRRVDMLCGSGPFRGWAQPTPISHPSSATFISATYEILNTLGEWSAWIGGPKPVSGITLIETNPTVAVAMMMPRVGLGQIASRKRPLPVDGVLITAKSDWYWRNGAGRQVARALAAGGALENIARETDHELCAALTCLALAHQFAGAAADKTRAVVVGDEDGVYLLPAGVDVTWRDHLEASTWGAEFRMATNGAFEFVDHSGECARTWGRLDLAAEESPQSEHSWGEDPGGLPDVAEAAKGEGVTLILADGGGVWEKHNAWLNDLPSPICVTPLAQPDLQIRLEHAQNYRNSGQWVLRPRAEQVARMTGKGADGPRLSLKNPWPVAVRILN